MPLNVQDLAQLGGEVVTVAIFVWYLLKKDNENSKETEAFIRAISTFNKTIQHYLQDSIKVKQELAEKFQRNTDVLENLEKLIDGEFKRITQKRIKDNIK